jgi:hypothetical protein
MRESKDQLQKGRNMSSIGPTYPAHFIVGQAEVKLVADQAENADSGMIRSDQNRVEAAQEVEAVNAKASNVDFVT